MANTYIKGKGCIIMVEKDGEMIPILGQTGGSISQSMETIEVMTKDETTAQVYGTTHSWEMSLDALYVLSDNGYELAMEKFQAAENVKVQVEVGGHILSGEGLITAIDHELGLEDMVSVSMTIQGSGDLTREAKA